MVQHKHHHKHFLVLYVLIAILGIWVFLVSAVQPGVTNDGQWVCAQTACAQSEPAGQAWAQENCGTITDNQTGQTVQACRVTIDGQEQVVRQDALNLSAIRNCLEYVCVQEVKVREANYSVNEPAQT